MLESPNNCDCVEKSDQYFSEFLHFKFLSICSIFITINPPDVCGDGNPRTKTVEKIMGEKNNSSL